MLEVHRADYRLERAATDRQARIAHRLGIIVKGIAAVGADLGDQLRPLHVLLRTNGFREVVELHADSDMLQVEELAAAVSATLLKDLLGSNEWREQAEATLADRVRGGMEGVEGVSDRELLDRADTLFACNACEASFRAPQAIRHCCTDGDTEDMAAKWPLDESTDPLDLIAPINEAGTERIQRLLGALGLDADVSYADLPAGSFVVSPLFRPELTATDHPQLGRVFPSFDDLVDALATGARLTRIVQAANALSTELDFCDHVRRLVNEDSTELGIELGVCLHGDYRVGPVREVERHMGVVCVCGSSGLLTRRRHGQYRLPGESLDDFEGFYMARETADA